MEPSKEAISVRVSRLNTQLMEKNLTLQNGSKIILNREGLLDAFTVLYDECNTDALKRNDNHVAKFVETFRSVLLDIKKIRVNISDFEVKNIIGRGHFGEVHVVREKQTNDVYALKTIRKSDSLNHQSASYEEERDIMAMNQSPWLTSLQYAFQDSAHLYLVMEFHSGGDLYGLLERQNGTLSEKHAIFYLAELVQAINALHSMGYVHRDVKPDNVLLDRCGHLKLADFGSAAKIGPSGTVLDKDVISVGTPDYIAPEVLQATDKTKNNKMKYGKGCDYWSLGILAYEISIGNTPFCGPTVISTYNKIMNYSTNLKFPSDVNLSENYIKFIRNLLADQNARLEYKKILNDALFKEIDWTILREQVPPFVPKVNGVDDTSNFLDVETKKSTPSIDNFKSRTQFSGRNLPFIGFTYTNCVSNHQTQITNTNKVNDESLLENKKKQVENLQKRLAKIEHSSNEYGALEKKYNDCNNKLENVETVRNDLEKKFASNIAETAALRRTLDLERRERKDLETRALELIKSAKLKWENAEKGRVAKLNEEIEKQTTRITELCTNNNELTSKLQRYKSQLVQTEQELERLKNLQTEYKDSLAQARALSRRSIAGVENRLERITSETKNQLTDLQLKLSDVLQNKKQLELQIDSYRQREQDLEDQYKASTELCDTMKKHLDTATIRCKELENEIVHIKKDTKLVDDLKSELTKRDIEIEQLKTSSNNHLEEALKQEKVECEALKKQLKELSKQLSESLTAHETVIHEHNLRRDNDITDLQNQLKSVSDDRDTLNRKLQEAYEKEVSNRIKVQNLEQLLSRLETGVSKLETGSDREDVLQEQVKRLEDQIRELHEASALEKQELRTANSSLWRKEKELSNCELDKRIVERELKTAETKIKEMEQEVAKLNSDINRMMQVHEETLSEINKKNELYVAEIKELKCFAHQMEEKSQKYHEKYENEKLTVAKLTNELNNLVDDMSKLKREIENEVKFRVSVEKECQNMREDNIKLHYKIDTANKNEFDACNKFESCNQELENARLNINVLRDACTILENQLEEYENLASIHENKEIKLSETVSQLNDEIQTMKNEIQDAKQLLNEERTLKILAETSCKRLQEDVELFKRECASYKDQVHEYKELSEQLSENLGLSEDRCGELETILKSLERQYENLKIDHISLKEESSQRLTLVHQSRETNYKLNQDIQDYKDEKASLYMKINELESKIKEQENYYNQRELKSQATIQQQTKLIDFLQSKIEDGKKKKSLSDKLFGSSKKENIPPSLSLNYRELESLLVKERENNKNLREQLNKFKSESLSVVKSDNDSNEICVATHSPKTKLALEQLVRSPASQNGGEFQRKPSMQRMHHNIPHRFESRMCTKTMKCVGCSENIQLGRSAFFCNECPTTAHRRCVPNVPRTCGLPNEFAKHFQRSISENNMKESPTTITSQSVIESWLKVPSDDNHGNWERKYVRLEDSVLAFYVHEPSGGLKAMKTIELCPEDGWGSVNGDVTSQEICPSVASTDLPFLMRVDVRPRTTCWPSSTQLLMALNASDKNNWMKVLCELFEKKYPNLNKNNYITLIKLERNLDTVCIEEISKDTFLIGCEEGLFASFNDHPLVQISGITYIQQIGILKSINTILMIADSNRSLIRAELRCVESLAKSVPCTKPTLTYSRLNINNKDGFHMFQLSDFKKNNILCTATSTQLIIIKYELETDNFIPLRMLDTAEPCSCILFTQHSIIVGANKFFEIDLKTFSADEFLDASDHKLANAISCYKLGSYPVAIMRINANPTEYLICFNEFGIFVDEYGRKNRENDLKWAHLPLVFSYCAPFLYIVQFSAVEIIQITPDSFNDTSSESLSCPDSIRLEFTKPKYLGSNKRGIYLCVKNEIIFINGKTISNNDSLLDSESSATNSSEVDGSDADTEFSFSTSIVNSLDRMSDASE